MQRKVIVEGQIRTVILGNSESWHVYIIVPRSVLIANLRYLRSRGWSYHDCDSSSIMPEGIGLEYHYGGPGRSFAHEGRIYTNNRRYRVYCQSGGLDI
jgi:hypothetical protein